MPKAVLGAVFQALNVGAVQPDDHSGHDHAANRAEHDGSGVRAAGNEYPIADDQFVLDFFAGMTGKPAAEIAHAVLTNVDFWGSDLTAEIPGFEASVAASLDAIFTKGAAKAIEEVVAKA